MKKIISLIGILSLIILFPCVSPGQQIEPEKVVNRDGVQDPVELGAFIDGIMTAHMEANHIAGATFSFVKDGEIFLSKGYGFADVAAKKLVLAEKTMFRPGSVSKLFTWTAVMQLYEQGKIDLDADVNSYLEKFKIPETFSEPITMKHLMTHTPGFEEMIKDMMVREPEDLWSLEKGVSTNIPQRVMPPGKMTSYSNYGSALAGHIVEVVSGISFEEYIEKNIFEPLEMKTSTFRQPVPEDLKEFMSVGYTYKKGLYHAEDFELFNGAAPAGALSSCAADIANFMIAHLQLGRFNDARILKEETARLMQSLLFTNHPQVSGNAYGFWEVKRNNLRMLSHGGDTMLFHSYLVLIPERNEGFFVSYNSVGGAGSPRGHLMQAILDRYYPDEIQEAVVLENSKERLRLCAGNYRPARVVHSTWAKPATIVMIQSVKVLDDNILFIAGGQWKEKEPFVFQEIGGKNSVVFKKGENGNVVNLFFDSNPYSAYIKIPWFESPVFSYILLGLCLIIFLSTLRWPRQKLLAKLCRSECDETRSSRPARWIAGGMSVLFLFFFLGLALSALDPLAVIIEIPLHFKLLFILPLIAVPLSLGAIVFSIMAWIKKYWSWCARLHYSLVVAASLAMLWFLNHWNLLGFKF